MNRIEQIKKELAEISPWPWKAFAYPDGRKLIAGQTRAVLHCPDAPISFKQPDFTFCAKSPERIAALIEHVEAAMMLLDNEIVAHYRHDFDLDLAMTKYCAARRKLGLE